MRKFTSNPVLLVFFFIVFLAFGCSDDKKEIDDVKVPEESISSVTVKQVVKPTFFIVDQDSLHLRDSVFIELSHLVDSQFQVSNTGTKGILKLSIDSVSLLNVSNSSYLKGYSYSLLEDKKSLSFDLASRLGANSEYSLTLYFSVTQYLNDEWSPVLDDEDGTQIVINAVKTFSTSKLPLNVLNCDLDEISIFNSAESSDGISVTVHLNYKEGAVFLITKDGHYPAQARAQIKQITLLQNEQALGSRLSVINDTTLLVSPLNVIESNKEYQVKVLIVYEEHSSEGWIPLKNAEGVLMEKEYTYIYNSIDYSGIPAQFIKYSYPISRQLNFYRNEYNKGYIEFVFNQEELLQTPAEDLTVAFLKHPYDVKNHEVDVEVESNTNTIWFDTPQDLEKGKVYRLQLLGDGNVLYQFEFRTSQHDKFEEKIPDELLVRFLYRSNALSNNQVPEFLGSTIYFEEAYMEGFEGYEVQHNSNPIPLVRFTPILDEWDWYNNSIYKSMYDIVKSKNIPVDFDHILSTSSPIIRNEGNLAPLSPFWIWQIDFNRILSDDEINKGNYSNYVDGMRAEFGHIVNTLPAVWARDYLKVRNYLKNTYTNKDQISDPTFAYIFDNVKFPSAGKGNYSIQIKYQLPGKDIVTTSKTVNIVNPFN